VGSPAEITSSCVAQIEMGDVLEATRCVKAGGQLVGERLVVNKAVCACRRYGALVQLHGLERASFDAGNLCSGQRRTILEILPTIRRPVPKLLLMASKCFPMLGVRI